MAVFIPDEVLWFRILPRLPGRSVYRFKCVSKQWQSSLTSEKFKKLHNRYIDEHQNHHKLVVISRTKEWTFNTIDCEAPHNGLTPSRPIPFNANPKNIEILTSFHGLVCVGIAEFDDIYTDLILWNPLTGEYKTLCRANSHRDCYKKVGKAFGLYYTSFDKDYKLVRVTDLGNVYIYSLKSDSWRKVDSIQHIPNNISERWRLSTWLNKNLYFLKQDRNVSPNSYPIIKFDTKTEKFMNIAIPSIDDEKSNRATLLVQRGCIYFCIKYGIGNIGFAYTRFELWKMNEDGNWKNVAIYQRKPREVCFLKPLHLMRNGNLLMVSGYFYNADRGYLYQVDLKKKKHSKGGDISKLRTLVSRGFSEEVRYIETFVSPNQYINLSCTGTETEMGTGTSTGKRQHPKIQETGTARKRPCVL